MTLTALRPTGDTIHLQFGTGAPTLADDYHVSWLDSGTAALALALIDARLRHTSRAPQVILPTYGCPDLVAAAEYAGVQPVLVDIQPDSPLYDDEQLQSAINGDTVAIVAATLLGVRADAKRLREHIASRPIALIEDSAQWFPRHSSQTFFGDYVVLSFGRGKPVNLLGGGALLTTLPLSDGSQRAITRADTTASAWLKYLIKVAAYNVLIHPVAYGLVEKLPFLSIGATVFHAQTHITDMPAPNRALLAGNLQRYCARAPQQAQAWKHNLRTLADNEIQDLCVTHHVPDDYAVLRYPLLIASAQRRQHLYEQLRGAGLGASIMYPKALFDIDGINRRARLHAGQDNARSFAQRLLTLPTHDGVTPAVITQTLALLKATTPMQHAIPATEQRS